jgi:putative membrane protein
MLAAFDFRILADVNAILNSIALILILTGLWAIKRGNERLHVRMMLAATGVSALFLTSYLTYHFNAEPVKYTGSGVMLYVYYAILISHVILAIVQVPLILLTIAFGLRDRRAKHRRLARITAPIWVYVSFTGVVYYWILYWL